MEPVSIIAIAAFLLSVLTFVATQWGSKRTSTESYVRQLETRIEVLERELGASKARNIELEGENLRLMKRLLAAPGA